MGAPMLAFRRGLIITLILLITISLALSHDTGMSLNKKPIIVCTTSVLASVAKDLVGDSAIVEVIASPAVCPAHYDVKPSDVEAFKEADLILMHGIEPWVEELRKASGSNAPVIKIPGPWNTPDALKSVYERVAKAIEENLGLDVKLRLERCIKAIDDTANYLKAYAEVHNFTGVPVVCMAWQIDFIKFLGFRIVASYGPPERVTAKEYEEIIKNATEAHAILVIDNVQSGTELGKKIALEIGGVEVALTNFPNMTPELNNMTMVMKWNAERLAEALTMAELKGRISTLKERLETYKTATYVLIAITTVLIIVTTGIVFKLRRTQ
ncbi:MAG: hypothetical protein DRJ66_06290 [Thermoprotei archaeon]|nr:MAG: hypothetical protein DRJ66_06290 [Thermoprotei archaeon]